jgi:hypothetical protein
LENDFVRPSALRLLAALPTAALLTATLLAATLPTGLLLLLARLLLAALLTALLAALLRFLVFITHGGCLLCGMVPPDINR